MTYIKGLCLLVFSVAVFCGVRAGEEATDTADGVSKRTVRQILIENAGVGTELHERIEQVGRMVSDNETARAMREIDLLLAEYKKLMAENGKVYISVSSDAQFIDYVRKNRKKDVVRVAWGLQKLLFSKAFILAEEKPQQALPVLDELLVYAPYSSDAYCERGYLYSLLKQPQQALDSYKNALELSEKFSSEKHSRGIALRGLGYAYTALGQYDKAKDAFKKSLEVDSNNQIALDGLKYISDMESRKGEKVSQ